ncbi:MAG TPA: lactonase family protein [Bacteroidales bacterium]|nr:lactonase family protein [Bacteroidales bacterium]
MKRNLVFLLLIALLTSSCYSPSTRLFIGSFTKNPGDKGMSVYDFNQKNGTIKLVSQSDVGPNPSYFCFSQEKNLFYVANEVTEFQGTAGGGLSTFKFDPESGTFQKEGEMAIPYGGPCFISLSPDSGHIFMANYPHGSVAVIRLSDKGIPERITDTILYVKDNPEASHAHMIKNDPAGKMIYVTDLGLDRIIRYEFDVNEGKLHPFDTLNVPKGLGPRHFDFSNDGSFLYVINELGSKITVFSLQEKKPELIQIVSTLKDGTQGKSFCADIHMTNDGKFIYGSNRGENSIVTFSVQPDGTLKLAGHTTCGGNWPRNFTLDPSNSFILAGNEKSDSIAIFRIDQKSGLPLEPGVRYAVAAPGCLKFYR